MRKQWNLKSQFWQCPRFWGRKGSGFKLIIWSFFQLSSVCVKTECWWCLNGGLGSYFQPVKQQKQNKSCTSLSLFWIGVACFGSLPLETKHMHTYMHKRGDLNVLWQEITLMLESHCSPLPAECDEDGCRQRDISSSALLLPHLLSRYVPFSFYIQYLSTVGGRNVGIFGL